MPTNEGNFLIESDGVPVIKVSEVNGLGIENTLSEIHEGNRALPHVVRGNSSVDEVTFKHGHAMPGAEGVAQNIFNWARSLSRGGVSVERRNLRVVLMDEAGLLPLRYYELRRCLPRKFNEDSRTAGGNNAATFTFIVKPEDVQIY
jgi:phage tail-like protein